MPETYGYWEVFDEMPDGWAIDKTCGSPMPRSVFITNNISPLNKGFKRAILRIKLDCPDEQKEAPKQEIREQSEPESKPEQTKFPSHLVNQLARKKFQEHILKEIMFDLMVCEIEGWDKREYIKEIKSLISKIDTRKTIKDDKQQKLFNHESI